MEVTQVQDDESQPRTNDFVSYPSVNVQLYCTMVALQQNAGLANQPPSINKSNNDLQCTWNIKTSRYNGL